MISLCLDGVIWQDKGMMNVFGLVKNGQQLVGVDAHLSSCK